MRRYFVAVALVLGSIFFAAFPKSALAASAFNLQISPLPIQLATPPGTTVGSDLRVLNAGSQTQHLRIHILKVTEDNDGGVHLTEPTASDTFVNWIHFDRSSITAPTNQWQTIHMTINVPTTAAFGYYFAVEYSPASEAKLQAGKEVTNGAVATFVLLDAQKAGAKREASLTSFTTDHKLYGILPVGFTAKIKSTGNVEVAPYGNIYIYKGKTQIGTIGINLAKSEVLPDSSQFFTAHWNDGFPYRQYYDSHGDALVDSKGRPKSVLKWDLSQIQKLRFGHYTAQLVMLYDNGQRDVPMQASVSFWVIPWQLVLGLIVLLAIIGVGLWSVFKRLRAGVKQVADKRRKHV